MNRKRTAPSAVPFSKTRTSTAPPGTDRRDCGTDEPSAPENSRRSVCPAKDRTRFQEGNRMTLIGSLQHKRAFRFASHLEEKKEYTRTYKIPPPRYRHKRLCFGKILSSHLCVKSFFLRIQSQITGCNIFPRQTLYRILNGYLTGTPWKLEKNLSVRQNVSLSEMMYKTEKKDGAVDRTVLYRLINSETKIPSLCGCRHWHRGGPGGWRACCQTPASPNSSSTSREPAARCSRPACLRAWGSRGPHRSSTW